jgi:trehalose 6-phosphate synthase/phosphatase
MPRWLRPLATAPRLLYALDYDGTLVPRMPRPELARPSPHLLHLLGRLADDAEVLVISGRPKRDLQAWLAASPLTLVAEHGHWLRRRGTRRWEEIVRVDAGWKPELRPLLRAWARRYPGAWLEEKSGSLAWHYRMAKIDARDVERLERLMKRALRGSGANVIHGSKVLEARARGIDKGRALRAVRRELGPFDAELVAGDDRTDEDMFAVAKRGTSTIKVGRGTTLARHRLRDPAALDRLLQAAWRARAKR